MTSPDGKMIPAAGARTRVDKQTAKDDHDAKGNGKKKQ